MCIKNCNSTSLEMYSSEVINKQSRKYNRENVVFALSRSHFLLYITKHFLKWTDKKE
jgi:hypothetical protein